MPPRDIQIIPRDPVRTPSDEIYQLKIVDKAMKLPLVADAVSLTKNTISPLVETMAPVAAKLEEPVACIKTKAEEALLLKISEGVKTNITSAVEKVSSAVNSLDSLACGGLDQLTERVPVLRGPTPEVIETTKEVAESYMGLLKEYLASFTLVQVALKMGDAGLSMVDSTLKMTGLEDKIPVCNTISSVRREARALRRAGIRRIEAQNPAVQTIGEVSLMGAVAEILCVNFFLSLVGLVLVPSKRCATNDATATFDTVKDEEVEKDEEEEMTVLERLSPEKLDAYESDKDPDYSPSDASDDSLEYESDAADSEKATKLLEVAVVYEDEHATVTAEVDAEEEPVIIDTEGGNTDEDETEEAKEVGTATHGSLKSSSASKKSTESVAQLSNNMVVLIAIKVAAETPQVNIIGGKTVVTTETYVSEDAALVLEPVEASGGAECVEVVKVIENQDLKKVSTRENTAVIDIVDIENDEVIVVEKDEEGEVVEEGISPKQVRPIHTSFLMGQSQDDLIEIFAAEDKDNEITTPAEEVFMGAESSPATTVIDTEGFVAVSDMTDTEESFDTTDIAGSEDLAAALYHPEHVECGEDLEVIAVIENHQISKVIVKEATEEIEIVEIYDGEVQVVNGGEVGESNIPSYEVPIHKAFTVGRSRDNTIEIDTSEDDASEILSLVDEELKEAEASLATPLNDTQGIVAVAAEFALFEICPVVKNPAESTESEVSGVATVVLDPVEASGCVECVEVVKVIENYKIKIGTLGEDTAVINIADIKNAEVQVLEKDEEGGVVEECISIKQVRPIHTSFLMGQSLDDLIEIGSTEYEDNEITTPVDEVYMGAESLPATNVIDTEGFVAVADMTDTEESDDATDIAGSKNLAGALDHSKHVKFGEDLEVVEVIENHQGSKVIVKEATEEIEIVHICDGEVQKVKDGKKERLGVEVGESNIHSYEEPIHKAFIVSRSRDNTIEIDTSEDDESEISSLLDEELTEAEVSSTTPLNDTQSIVAVAAELAVLEIGLVVKNPAESTETEDYGDATVVLDPVEASGCVESVEFVKVIENHEIKKGILGEDTAVINIVDIENAEVQIVENGEEGKVVEECISPKQFRPIHTAFLMGQTQDDQIEIRSVEDKDDEITTPADEVYMGAESSPATTVIDKEGFLAVADMADTETAVPSGAPHSTKHFECSEDLEVVEVIENHQMKVIGTEATEEIEIVDIYDGEVQMVKDSEEGVGVEVGESNIPRYEEPMHKNFLVGQSLVKNENEHSSLLDEESTDTEEIAKPLNDTQGIVAGLVVENPVDSAEIEVSVDLKVLEPVQLSEDLNGLVLGVSDHGRKENKNTPTEVTEEIKNAVIDDVKVHTAEDQCNAIGNDTAEKKKQEKCKNKKKQGKSKKNIRKF